MKTRNLVSMFLVMCLLMGLGSAVARAEGDIYTLGAEGYPNRHWALMEPDEYQSYLDAGWIPYTGVLWYHQEDDGSLKYVGDPPAVSIRSRISCTTMGGGSLFCITGSMTDRLSVSIANRVNR